MLIRLSGGITAAEARGSDVGDEQFTTARHNQMQIRGAGQSPKISQAGSPSGDNNAHGLGLPTSEQNRSPSLIKTGGAPGA